MDVGGDLSRVKRDFDTAAGHADERKVGQAAGRYLRTERFLLNNIAVDMRTVLSGNLGPEPVEGSETVAEDIDRFHRTRQEDHSPSQPSVEIPENLLTVFEPESL